jgi:hypothetical protein
VEANIKGTGPNLGTLRYNTAGRKKGTQRVDITTANPM